MENDNFDIDGRRRVIERCKEFYARNNISKEDWCEKTGFSEDQWYRWHNVNSNSTPGIDQARKVFDELDMSPLKVWYGVGPDKLSTTCTILKANKKARHSIEKLFAEGAIEARHELQIKTESMVAELHATFLDDSAPTHTENWEKIDKLISQVDLLVKRTAHAARIRSNTEDLVERIEQLERQIAS